CRSLKGLRQAFGRGRRKATSGVPRDVTNPIAVLKDVRLTLSSRAGAVEILRGIDLAVEEGQSVAIVGPSGSGKTSLLMVLAGLERASGGSVRVVGEDFRAAGEDRL